MEMQIYGPLELPSGQKIKFREARGRDRANVIQAQKMTMDNMASATLLIDNLVAIKCIVEVDGTSASGDYKRMFEDMSGADIDYYMSVRQEMFGMTDDKRTQAKDAASFLLNKQTSTDSSSSPSTDTSAATVNG
jgi:hypothetical protein